MLLEEDLSPSRETVVASCWVQEEEAKWCWVEAGCTELVVQGR